MYKTVSTARLQNIQTKNINETALSNFILQQKKTFKFFRFNIDQDTDQTRMFLRHYINKSFERI